MSAHQGRTPSRLKLLPTLAVAAIAIAGCGDPVADSRAESLEALESIEHELIEEQAAAGDTEAEVGNNAQLGDESNDSELGATSGVADASTDAESEDETGGAMTSEGESNEDEGQEATSEQEEPSPAELEGSSLDGHASEYCALIEIGYLNELDGNDGRTELSEGALMASEAGSSTYADVAEEVLEALPGDGQQVVEAADAFLDRCANEGYERL